MRMTRRSRRAFTLIELLVVLAILGILAAMTAAGVMRFTGVGIGRATQANMGKVHAKLNEQWKAVSDAANKDSISPGTPGNTLVNHPQVNLTGAPLNLADENTRKRYVQLRQIQAFPMSFYEAFWLDGTVQKGSAPYAWPAYVAYLL